MITQDDVAQINLQHQLLHALWATRMLYVCVGWVKSTIQEGLEKVYNNPFLFQSKEISPIVNTIMWVSTVQSVLISL